MPHLHTIKEQTSKNVSWKTETPPGLSLKSMVYPGHVRLGCRTGDSPLLQTKHPSLRGSSAKLNEPHS